MIVSHATLIKKYVLNACKMSRKGVKSVNIDATTVASVKVATIEIQVKLL
jgi:hypothetical protein